VPAAVFGTIHKTRTAAKGRRCISCSKRPYRRLPSPIAQPTGSGCPTGCIELSHGGSRGGGSVGCAPRASEYAARSSPAPSMKGIPNRETPHMPIPSAKMSGAGRIRIGSRKPRNISAQIIQATLRRLGMKTLRQCHARPRRANVSYSNDDSRRHALWQPALYKHGRLSV